MFTIPIYCHFHIISGNDRAGGNFNPALQELRVMAFNIKIITLGSQLAKHYPSPSINPQFIIIR